VLHLWRSHSSLKVALESTLAQVKKMCWSFLDLCLVSFFWPQKVVDLVSKFYLNHSGELKE